MKTKVGLFGIGRNSYWPQLVGLRLIKKGVGIIWFGDYFGTQISRIISPETFREQLKLLYKRLIDRFKEAKPDIIQMISSKKSTLWEEMVGI